ncbi:MAG: metallophosphoesterase [Propionibacteriaceae bacterium]|jgi:3',5'-cyclic AMP phosphodiesterase CpdA|nr:metallophosphoesterase [Propionibacteriaceae bacterium]
MASSGRSYTLLHLSDTHFVDGGAPLYGRIDVEGPLAAALERLSASGRQIDAIVVSGDVADAGQLDAYRRARALLEPVADRLGAELVWAMGNHDQRQSFRAGLLDLEPSDRPVDTVAWVGGLRLIVLDSTVPGRQDGLIDRAQLDWLRRQWERPAPDGSVLVLHHPPIAPELALLDSVALRQSDELAQALAGGDLRLVLCGHYHYPTQALWSGLLTLAAGACSYSQDLLIDQSAMRAERAAQSFGLVRLEPGRVVNTVVPLAAGETLYELTAAELRRIVEPAPLAAGPAES